MSEVQGGGLSSPRGKQHVWVLAVRLRDRKGTRVKGEKREGREESYDHSQRHPNFPRAPLHTRSRNTPSHGAPATHSPTTLLTPAGQTWASPHGRLS